MSPTTDVYLTMERALVNPYTFAVVVAGLKSLAKRALALAHRAIARFSR
jgi:hypothetical protein